MEGDKDFICDFLERFTFRLAHGKLKTLQNCKSPDLSRVVDFQEKCIKLYKSLQTSYKSFNPGEVKLYVSAKMLKEIQGVWKEIYPDIEDFTQKDFLEVEDGNQNFFASYDRLTNLQFCLDPPIVTEKCIRWILEKRTKFKQPGLEDYKVEIAMSGDSIHETNLMQLQEYRKHLLARIILNSLKLKGYTVEETKYYLLPDAQTLQNDIFLITKKLTKQTASCTPSECKNQNRFDSRISSHQVLQIKIGQVSEQRAKTSSPELEAHGYNYLPTLGSILSHSESCTSGAQHGPNELSLLNYEILSKKPSSEVIVRIDDTPNPSQMQDPVLINYTISRIHSILNKFSRGILRQDYANLPDAIDINFSCLTKSAEEVSLIDALMEWPRIMDCVIDLSTGELMIPSLLRFLAELAHRFKVFYAKHVVLLTPSAHEFGVMYARIYLLRAILVIFEETLQLLGGFL